jgi:hypothetical protein
MRSSAIVQVATTHKEIRKQPGYSYDLLATHGKLSINPYISTQVVHRAEHQFNQSARGTRDAGDL